MNLKTVLSILFMVFNMFKEMMQIFIEGKHYIADEFNRVDLIVYVLVGIC